MQLQQNLHILLTVGIALALVKAVVITLVLTVVVVVTIITANFSDIFDYVKGLYKL